MAAALEDVANGVCDRLMIFTPPRHGKSELASRRFPAWYLGNNPSKQIIATSYNSDLAGDFGREVRNIVKSPEYGVLFKTGLAEDSQAANRWHTSGGGSYVAAGVGTAITGRGADVLLIDDPVKDREEADSELRRKRVWDWYTSTALTRLMPGGAVVVIQTRWHEDDLSGRLLENGDEWRVLSLPAINEDNEALWPDRYDLASLERIRKALPLRDWSALYQQQPSPEDGDFFKREWFRYYDEMPDRDRLRVYGASDYAVTDGGGDYTVHGVFGIDSEGKVYLLDLWRGQKDSGVWIEAFLDLVERWKPVSWAEEGGQIRAALGPFIEQRIRQRNTYVLREQFPSRANKEVRAQSIRGRVSLDGLYLPKAAPWLQAFESELLTFPAGAHDDQVDVLGLFGQLLDKVQNGGAAPFKQPSTRWVV